MLSYLTLAGGGEKATGWTKYINTSESVSYKRINHYRTWKCLWGISGECFWESISGEF